jgi:hypothetical protein
VVVANLRVVALMGRGPDAVRLRRPGGGQAGRHQGSRRHIGVFWEEEKERLLKHMGSLPSLRDTHLDFRQRRACGTRARTPGHVRRAAPRPLFDPTNGIGEAPQRTITANVASHASQAPLWRSHRRCARRRRGCAPRRVTGPGGELHVPGSPNPPPLSLGRSYRPDPSHRICGCVVVLGVFQTDLRASISNAWFRGRGVDMGREFNLILQEQNMPDTRLHWSGHNVSWTSMSLRMQPDNVNQLSPPGSNIARAGVASRQRQC